MASEMKKCTRCSKSKVVGEFHNDSRKSDGLHSWCKECMLKQKAKHYTTNRDAILQDKAEYRLANIGKTQAKDVLNRAVRSGKAIRPDTCSSCGVGCRPDGHHFSYHPEHMLHVRWLCRSCHLATHAFQAMARERINHGAR